MSRLLPLVAILASLALPVTAGPAAAAGDEASSLLTVTRSARGPSLTEIAQSILGVNDDAASEGRPADHPTVVSSIPAYGRAIFEELRAAED